MKKFSLMIGAAAVAAVATAAEPSWIMFSSEGPDKYADGSIVRDGEVYALVHSKDGEFKGVDAIGGNLVDAENDTLVGLAAIAENGGCPPVAFILDDGDQDLADSSTVNGEVVQCFGVYLLDTRVTTAAGETVAKDRSGAAVDISNANGYQKVAATITKKGSTSVTTEAALTGSGNVGTALPADFPQPVIAGFDVDEANNQVYVTVSNTVDYVRYTITGGATLDEMVNKHLVDEINGVGANTPLTLVVEDPKANKFFKVVRGE